jgi:hypothetical protein
MGRRFWRFMASKINVRPQKEEVPENEGPETSLPTFPTRPSKS